VRLIEHYISLLSLFFRNSFQLAGSKDEEFEGPEEQEAEEQEPEEPEEQARKGAAWH